MSDDSAGDFFALPAFKADEALIGLKRQLRDLRPLAERGNGFDIGGKRVLEFTPEGGALTARLAKRPAVSPEWETRALKSGADVRKCVDEVKKRLARWQQDAE